MNPKSILKLLFLTTLHYTSSQSITGTVIDGRTMKPITAATIKVTPLQITTTTDTEGMFVLSKIPPGSYVLQMIAEGYISKNLPFKKVAFEANYFNELFLEPDIQELKHENIIVLSENDFLDEVEADYTGGMLQATRDVFLTHAAFDFSQAFFKVKGYDASYGTVLINGVRMTDISYGKPIWNNWGGLNDVLRNQAYYHQLKHNPYEFGGIVGTTHINTSPFQMRPGFRISTSASNRSYRGRLMTTYSSGQLKNNIAYTISTSRRWANEGYIDGTLYDAYSLFGTIGYKTQHHEMFISGFYTPNRRGKSAPITQEVFDLVGRKYNPYWGRQNGVIRNSRIRNISEPFFMFNYSYTGKKINVEIGTAYKFGLYASSRLGYFNAPSPNPDYYRYLPSFYINNESGANFENANLSKEAFINDPQLNWNALYNANTNSNSIGKSVYILYDDHKDSKVFSLGSNTTYYFNQHFKANVGLQYQGTKIENYGLLKDLLGGSYHEDIDSFSNTNNDVEGEDQKTFNSKINYNYNLTAQVYDIFLQAQYERNRFNAFLSGKIAQTTYQREGLFLNERYPENSKGKSKQLIFSDYGLKGGIDYKISNRHLVGISAVYLIKAPILQNSFINSREHNQTIPKITSEKILTTHLNYYLRLPKLTGRITTYYTHINDAIDLNFFYADAGVGSDFVQEAVTGISKTHYGFELGMAYQATSEIRLMAAASHGKFTYSDNPEVSISFDTSGAEDTMINQEGFLNLRMAKVKSYKVASGPQKAFLAGVEFRSPKYWWTGITMSYLDDNYIDIAMIKRTQSFFQNPEGDAFDTLTPENIETVLKQEKLSPIYFINLTGGKSWLVNKKYIGLFVSINNLFDVTYRTGGFEQARNANFRQAYKDLQRDTPSFGNKYWYGYGRTYFVNLSIGF